MEKSEQKNFVLQGNAFRINNQDIREHPITLVIHDKDYVSWTAAGEAVFRDQCPYAYFGTSPWLGTQTNDITLPLEDPLSKKIEELLFAQGEFGIVVYAVSEQTLRTQQKEISRLCKRYDRSRHILLKVSDADKTDLKEQFALENEIELVKCSDQNDAEKFFEEIKEIILHMDRPVYADMLEREPAEWTNFSVRQSTGQEMKRVLLLGDSISVGYGDFVQEELSNYHIDRLNTSEGTHHPNLYRMLQILLTQYHYDVIHMNIGIHVHGVDTQEYGMNLRRLFQWIRMNSPETKIVFATTTSASRKREQITKTEYKNFKLGDRNPLTESRDQEEYYYSPEDSALYKELNDTAKKVCREYQISVNDLFDVCVSLDLPKADVVHFKKEGYRELAKAAAKILKEVY